MERTYKDYKIVRNMDGKWIVSGLYGGLTQCATLADAKERINMKLESDALREMDA